MTSDHDCADWRGLFGGKRAVPMMLLVLGYGYCTVDVALMLMLMDGGYVVIITPNRAETLYVGTRESFFWPKSLGFRCVFCRGCVSA